MRTYTDIDPDRGRVVVSYTHTLDVLDIREMMSTSAKAGALAFPTLIDARDVQVLLTVDDLRTVRQCVEEFAARFRIAACAVLVTSQHAFTIATHAADVLADLSPVKGFFERREAERWLGWEA